MAGVGVEVAKVTTVVAGPLQMVPRKVGLGVGDRGVQSNDCEGSVPPL